jgi:hypothetical protein
MGGPLRRRKFNRAVGWSYVVAAIGVPGLHFHDLRHTGNTFAAATGAGLRDLMARMGHDSERAAMIYQHEARGADAAITGGIDAHVQAERGHEGDGDDGAAGVLVPADHRHINGTEDQLRRADDQATGEETGPDL